MFEKLIQKAALLELTLAPEVDLAGGQVAERWWKGGGKVAERWWKGGGKVVERLGG